MAKKEYGYLVKPMLVRNAPDRLYDEPRVWMEAKDLEGFNAHFSFGFVKKPTVFHPVEGAVVHPYDEILVFGGFANGDILHLGGEISVELGEEHEKHVFDKPSLVLIPRGTPHGPVTVSRVDTPFVHYSIGLAPEYKATSLPKGAPSSGAKHAHLIKPLKTVLETRAVGSGMGYERVTDENGIMRPSERGIGPGNGDQIVWLFGKNLEGMDVNFTWGLYSKCGKWHRGGEAHTHPEAEILCFVGLDPNDINYLGAELELGLGKDYERHVYNKPTVVVCPQGFPHLPLVTRWVDKPYGFFVICLSGEHDSPWVEA
jgi:hypothetical protein